MKVFWGVVVPWVGFLLLSVYVITDSFKDKSMSISRLERYAASHPELGKYYKVLEPITPGTLKFIYACDKDQSEMEGMLLKSMLKAGRSGDLTNMFLRMESMINDNEKGLKFLEMAIRDPFESGFVPRTQDKDVLCCFLFEHPSLVELGFIVFRNGKMVYRNPGNEYRVPDELEEVGFEQTINEL